MKSIFGKAFIGIFMGVIVLGGGAAAHASALTSAQVQAVISLLQNFNVDQNTIATVNAALTNSNSIPSGGLSWGPWCPTITTNLYLGVTDRSTGGQVSQLQQFLGMSPVGVFGLKTRAAVADFQRQYSIYPVTGGVGPITREYIAKVCAGGTPLPWPTPVTTPVPTQTSFNFNTSFQVAVGQTVLEYSAKQLNLEVVSVNGSSAQVTMGENCIQGTQCFYYPHQTVTMSLNQSLTFQGYTIVLTGINGNYATFYVTHGSVSVAPIVNSVSPTSGSVGSTVTIYGSGFTADNAVMFGLGGLQHITSSNGGTQLTFTVPSAVGAVCSAGMMCPNYMVAITPNTYTLSVTNSNGQSNSVSFTVTSTSGTNSNSNTTISFTTPTVNQTFTRGQALPISWSANNAPVNSSVVLDLYTEANVKVGTIAIPQTNAGYYSWSIPSFPQNYMCTMQYPNGLCGANIPSGRYYVQATVTSDGFNPTSANTSAMTKSGIFTINQQ